MNQSEILSTTKTAILIDGGFYRVRANHIWGEKTPQERADELIKYTYEHLNKTDGPSRRLLYRIFYYDCPPTDVTVYHPLLGRNIEFRKKPQYQWMTEFLDCLTRKRKVAIRLGRLSDVRAHFSLRDDVVTELCRKQRTVDDLTEGDFKISFMQKGVDMRIGIDTSSLAYEGIVDQIILVSGDSDFVPAAKAARRKGIDFIVDPLGVRLSDDLFEHIDGLESFHRTFAG